VDKQIVEVYQLGTKEVRYKYTNIQNMRWSLKGNDNDNTDEDEEKMVEDYVDNARLYRSIM
jgi:hypothetical protein